MKRKSLIGTVIHKINSLTEYGRQRNEIQDLREQIRDQENELNQMFDEVLAHLIPLMEEAEANGGEFPCESLSTFGKNDSISMTQVEQKDNPKTGKVHDVETKTTLAKRFRDGVFVLIEETANANMREGNLNRIQKTSSVDIQSDMAFYLAYKKSSKVIDDVEQINQRTVTVSGEKVDVKNEESSYCGFTRVNDVSYGELSTVEALKDVMNLTDKMIRTCWEIGKFHGVGVVADAEQGVHHCNGK